MDAWRIGLATVAAGLALAGCSPQPAPPPPPPAPVVSYDGTYQATVTLTGFGSGVPKIGCATDPHPVFQVANNTFTYSQTHPKATISAPGFPTTNATATYTVTIAPNGSMSGQSQLSGQMTGTVAGGHMSGTVDGIECVYSFTADRG